MAAEIVPWAEDVKKTGKLRIALDASIGEQGWAKAFKEGTAKFNELSATTWKLGVTYESVENPVAANVVAYAKVGDFEFQYSDAQIEMAKKSYKFDGSSMHGMCSLAYGMVPNPIKKVDEKRLVKAFIFVPAKPRISGGQSRLVGEPVRLVVAVHEMIHACGLDDRHHTVDDVFCWPRARFDSDNPQNDRVEAFTGKYKNVTIAGKQISEPIMVAMPPVFLNKPTQDKIRTLWR